MNRIRKPRHRHVLATPLVDVLDVRVHSGPTGFHDLAIYGYIRVINSRLAGDAKAFTLFDRDENNPHSMRSSQSLPLTCSSPILPSEYTKLDVCLFNKKAGNRRVVVAKGKIVLSEESLACEKVLYGYMRLYFASIKYSVLQYGVAATVGVLFFSKDDKFDLLTKEKDTKEEKTEDKNNSVVADKVDVIDYDRRERKEDGVVADVFGSVSAFCNVTKEKRQRSISLFSESREEAVRVKSGDFIPLSRSLVIVPAYSSSLAVEVKLSLGNTGEPLASGIFECTPRDRFTYDKDLDGGEHGRVRVRVTWTHAYDQQFYHEKKQEYQDVKRRSESDRVEVFSVAVHSKNSRDDFSFYGRVEVEDINELCIYNRDKSSPQAGALGPLKGPHSRSFRSGDYFWIRAHLKDGTTGAEISNGQVGWDNRLITEWNERRLCSVIPGEVGFAAVHYTPFSDKYSWSYRVNVKLDGEQLQVPGGGYVYGKIVARYSTYEYSRAYDKKYFENILFDSRHSEADDGLQAALGCGSDVPLLKSVVNLPDDSNLVIEVDLAVASHPSLDGELLKGILELTHKQPHQQLNAKTFHMDVSMSMLPWDAAFGNILS